MDKQLSALLLPYSLSPRFASEMLKRTAAERQDHETSAEGTNAALRNEIAKITARIVRLKEAYLDGLDGEIFRSDNLALMGKRRALQEQMANTKHAPVRWLEPFVYWISDAQRSGQIAASGSLMEKGNLARKIFGSNLLLDGKKAGGEAVKPWLLLAEYPLSDDVARLYEVARTYFQLNGTPQDAPDTK